MNAAMTAAPEAAEGTLRLVTRWPAARPFVGLGATSVVAGGLIAAATRPTHFELGSWLAAYLVLVGGVAQIALGAGQAWIADQPPSARVVRAEILLWNVALGATVIGSVTSAPVATSVGVVATVLALGLFLRGVGARAHAMRWLRWAYRGVIVVVLIGAPIGLALAWTRHG